MPPTVEAPAQPASQAVRQTRPPAPCPTPQRRHHARAKRVLDFSVAVLGLVFLSPVLLGIALLVRLSVGGPVLFRQKRAGRYSRPFIVFKFSTMSQERDGNGWLLPETQRLTPTGRFLRAYSLDELPQLWNVLRGNMSLVGPRPLLYEYLAIYTPEQLRRHDVLPGITGWAQVKGRNSLAWEERFELDLWYIDHWSLWLDARILLLTLRHLLKRDGIDPEGLGIVPDVSIEPAVIRPPSCEFEGGLGTQFAGSEVACND